MASTINRPQTPVDSATGHHLKLKKPLPSRWGFRFCGLMKISYQAILFLSRLLADSRLP